MAATITTENSSPFPVQLASISSSRHSARFRINSEDQSRSSARSSLQGYVIDTDLISSPPTTPTASDSAAGEHRFPCKSPVSPPPASPLPPLPTTSSTFRSTSTSNVPIKPKLQPKRELSRSPSPIIKQEGRLPIRSNMLPRSTISDVPRPKEQRPIRSRQVHQEGYAISDEVDEGFARMQHHQTRAGGPKFTKVGSPADIISNRQADFVPMPAAEGRTMSPTVTTFHSQSGPILLNLRKGQEASIPRSSHQNEASKPQSHQARSQQGQSRYRSRLVDLEPSTIADDVVMRDHEIDNGDIHHQDGFNEDDEFNEDEFEYLTQPHMGNFPDHFTRETGNNVEPAWADDASVLDFDERSFSQNSQPEEAFEVAALRRQVEQLQMALKKQMTTTENSRERGAAPGGSGSSSSKLTALGTRYAYGVPTPDASRDGSMVGSAVKTSPSSNISRREQQQQYTDRNHVPPSNSYGREQPNNASYHRRQYAPASRHHHHHHLHNQEAQLYEEFNAPIRSGYVRQRVISDPPSMSSLAVDESASNFARPEDAKIDELSRKIQALEALFKTSSLSPSQSSDAGSTNSPMQQLSNRQQANGIVSSSSNSNRRPSLSTISTFDGASYGRQSPAASAFNYNATPYSRDNFELSKAKLGSGNSSNSIDRPRKGVARFIMGVGSSKGNVPRDEHGNPLPSMQVSWSRKRTEKVAKPVNGQKMKVGPGRGRIVMKAPPS